MGNWGTQNQGEMQINSSVFKSHSQWTIKQIMSAGMAFNRAF